MKFIYSLICVIVDQILITTYIFFLVNRYPGLMKPGMTFTIEPVLSHGNENTVVLDDGWTVVTEDGSRAAQVEHTVLVTKDGYEVLTK